MFTKKQIKAIIDTLKDKAIEYRPALRQIFEQDGYLWATNGFIALELGEVKDELKGKRITLERLIGWYGTHKNSDNTNLIELMEDNPESTPEMTKLLHKEYEPATSVNIDIDYLNIAAKFLGVHRIGFEAADNNGSNCYRIKPLEEMHVAHEAMEIKAYVMGLGR